MSRTPDTVNFARARIKVLLENPFFGALLMNLVPVAEPTVGTVDTDGQSLFFNPKWAADQPVELLAAVLCHAVLHCALGHLWRRDARERKRWDVACDLVVNLVLADAGWRLPPGLQPNQAFRGQSAEEVYSRLSQAADPVGGGENETTENQPDGHLHWEDLQRAGVLQRTADLPRIWEERVARAEGSARGCGRLSGDLERSIERLFRAQKDWREILAEFLLPLKADYTWVPPDRRLLPYRIIVPDLGDAAEQVDDLVIAVDTSGSVEDSQLTVFLSEVRGLLDSFPRITGHLVFCDSQIKEWRSLADYTKVQPAGGGGTDTRPVFAEIERRGLNPTALVYCTDGRAVYPSRPPDYPVLWVLTRDHVAPPWGRKLILQSNTSA